MKTEPKILKSVKILAVRAYPLDKKLQNVGREFFITFDKGFKMPPIKEEFLIPNLRNAAKGIMSGDRLGYRYNAGDITVFRVKYKMDSKSGVGELTFVTKKSEK